MEKEFIRTASGLNNEHLFHNVNYIVYLEGGSNSYNLNEVINEDKFNEKTLDNAFWSKIFKLYLPDKLVRFKSIGSKIVLLQIADIVLKQDIDNILICMDNEFDELLGKRLEDKRVYYTYGYSWENEVWTYETVCNVIENNSCIEPDKNEIGIRYSSFINHITNAVKADYIAFAHGDSFIPREGYLKYVNLDEAHCPLKTDKINHDLVSSQWGNTDSLNEIDIDIQKYCYGHLLADYCFHITKNHLLKELSLSCPTRDTCNRQAINESFRSEHSEQIKEHYIKQFVRLVKN